MAAKHVLQLKQEAEEADPQKTLDANSHIEDFPSRSFHALSSRDSRNCTVKGGNNYHHIDLLHHNDQNQVALPPGSRVTDFVRRGQGSKKHKYAGLNATGTKSMWMSFGASGGRQFLSAFCGRWNLEREMTNSTRRSPPLDPFMEILLRKEATYVTDTLMCACGVVM